MQKLSLGNQQRVQLAAALAHDPEVLVLDEPFSGIDPTAVEVMSEVLRERAADGVPVIFSSHQLELVERSRSSSCCCWPRSSRGSCSPGRSSAWWDRLPQLVILDVIGVEESAATGLLTVPGAAVGMFAMVIAWYLLGFTLFAAPEELDPVVGPMIFVNLIRFVLTVNLLPNDPRNELAAVLSFLPFFARTVMPARYALGVAPLWQVIVSALIPTRWCCSPAASTATRSCARAGGCGWWTPCGAVDRCSISGWSAWSRP